MLDMHYYIALPSGFFFSPYKSFCFRHAVLHTDSAECWIVSVFLYHTCYASYI